VLPLAGLRLAIASTSLAIHGGVRDVLLNRAAPHEAVPLLCGRSFHIIAPPLFGRRPWMGRVTVLPTHSHRQPFDDWVFEIQVYVPE